jgi:prophage regulatory protein
MKTNTNTILYTPNLVFLKFSQFCAITALPRSTLYRKIAHDEFPRPVRLGKNSVAWRSDEVQNWINSREIAKTEVIK